MEHLDHPSPHFNDAKMARFLLLRAFIIALVGGWGIIVPFYTVQDCRCPIFLNAIEEDYM